MQSTTKPFRYKDRLNRLLEDYGYANDGEEQGWADKEDDAKKLDLLLVHNIVKNGTSILDLGGATTLLYNHLRESGVKTHYVNAQAGLNGTDRYNVVVAFGVSERLATHQQIKDYVDRTVNSTKKFYVMDFSKERNKDVILEIFKQYGKVGVIDSNESFVVVLER